MTTSRGGFSAAFFALALAGTTFGCSKGSDDGPASAGSGGISGGSGGRSGSGGSASGGGGTGGSPAGSGGSSTSAGGGDGGGGVNTGGDSGSGTGGARADAADPPGTGGTLGTGGTGVDAALPPADAPTSDGPMVLTSSVFKEGQDIAKLYMCKHENVTPPLAWTPGPPGTLSYAVTMLHAPAIHWALWDIPASTTSLPMDIAKMPMPPVPVGSKQAKPNIDGATWYGYTGPCPATASHYEYIVHALKVTTLPGVTPDSSTAVVNAAIAKNELKSAQLSGTASAK
jgi:phosphatidylethanolamine-binding protein (PEBP) family uncharacterized protein